MSTLLPCPFCGGEARYERPLSGHALSRSDSAECESCDVCLVYDHDFGTEETISAAEKWNRRAIESALRSRVEALEGAIRWALGEIGDFRLREDGEGAFWWRTELRRRAALCEELRAEIREDIRKDTARAALQSDKGEPCGTCGGSGDGPPSTPDDPYATGFKPCSSCGGTGRQQPDKGERCGACGGKRVVPCAPTFYNDGERSRPCPDCSEAP